MTGRKSHRAVKLPVCGHFPHKKSGSRAGVKCGKPATRAFLRPGGTLTVFRCEEHKTRVVINATIWKALVEVSVKDAMNLIVVDEVQSS